MRNELIEYILQHFSPSLPAVPTTMTRVELINTLITRYQYTSYLEIGVNTPAQPGYSHKSINVPVKHGVDPNVDTTYRTTSDDFFARCDRKYDIIFIDGLHLHEQVLRDIENALRCLSPLGVIVVHDCCPTSERTQRRERCTAAWHGDVWKAILMLRMTRPDLEIFTVNTDEGCAIVRPGSQECYVPQPSTNPYSWGHFCENYREILQLIDVPDFLGRLGLSRPDATRTDHGLAGWCNRALGLFPHRGVSR
jgi:hypothetical protein